jgi:uncharacterized membrane protein
MKDGDISAMSLKGMLHQLGADQSQTGLRHGNAAVFFFSGWRCFPGKTSRWRCRCRLNYVLVAFLSQYFLGEVVTPMRWAGTILVCIGVVLITKSSVA